ncbi:MAG: hypothetical protein JO149_06615 [Gammaproteobacteria bacterium]|nr:hypothetical protein [Gammaproteobacteria bacterium]
MLNAFLLAVRLLWRECRRGQWFIIFFALLLAVTVITGLAFYTDKLTRGLENQSASLLGGDLVISSPLPLNKAWQEKAQTMNLRTAIIWLYPSVVSAASKLQLVNIQAVSHDYPLFAEKPLLLAANVAWIETRLLNLLGISLHDEVTIGAAKFHVQTKALSDLGTLNAGWIIAPSVMIRLDDVPKTQTVLPGSRVDYRLLIAGDAQSIKAFRRWIIPQLKPSQRLLDINNQQFVMHDTLQRAENYIQLVLLICLLMSGIVIAVSIRQYIKRHYIHVALWRCLGAEEKQIKLIFIWQLFLLAFVAGIIGISLGYFLQTILAAIFKEYLQFPLPTTSLAPIALGFITSQFLLFAYAYPLMSELPKTSPLYIWREEVKISTRYFPTFLALLFLLAYIYWAMDFSLLALFFLDVILLSIGFLYAFNLLVLRAIAKIRPLTQGPLRRGLTELIYHPESTGLQLTAFTLILLSLIVLALLRNNLIEHWRSNLPANTPNYFAFNIAPTDVAAVQSFFKSHHIQIAAIYPMVRGRLTALNGQPIMRAIPQAARAHNALHRELNLSAMLSYPADNKIVKGKAWTMQDKGKYLISVATNLSDDLHFKLGDQLTFQIGDEKITAIISNIRTLAWESFHPNFYVIFPPGVINHFSTTYITSFYLQPTQTILLNQLIHQFPNVTVLDIAAIVKQAQFFIDKITSALAYLFFFACGIGILIFITCLQASQDERHQTYYLLRVLGASKKYIYKSLIVEFTCLAVLVIIFASFLAYVISWLLMKTIF